MINDNITTLDITEIERWLSEEAGTNNHLHFGNSFSGGLYLQQVPKEYAALLNWLRKTDIKKYLAIGIGNGGSFITECLFLQKTLIKAVAVDNLAYTGLTEQNINDINQK